MSICGPDDHANYIIETVGSGVAFLDYDNDGFLDILILSGTRLEQPSNTSSIRLYRNQGDGSFLDVTEKAGLSLHGWMNGVTVGDFDNDGFDDLLITSWNRVVLFRNQGDGTFRNITADAGLTDFRGFGSGCSWIDFDRDGWLDLVFAVYLDFQMGEVPRPGVNPACNFKGVPVMCGPRGLPPGRLFLYKNNRDGTFTDVSLASGLSDVPAGYPMTIAAADFRNSGWPDIYVACDSTPSLLLVNQKNGRFLEEALERGAALSEDGAEQAGMGLGIGDFNGSGHLDIFKTHFTDDTHILYKNDGSGNFEDVTTLAGLGVETRYVGWGTGIVDFDNDGLPDIFAVTGNVYPGLEEKLPNYGYKTPRILFRNLGNGRFEQILGGAGPGIDALHSSRGCAFGDFDNDGDMDIVVMNMNEAPSLLRNDLAASNNWLKVRLVGTSSNRSAVGARVTARYGGRVQSQELMAQSSFYSSNDPRLHFGLGKERSVDLEVRWPGGLVQMFRALPVNRLILLREGDSEWHSGKFPAIRGQ